MRNQLMRLAMMGAAQWAGNRAMRQRSPGVRAAGRGLSTAAWALPLAMYAARRFRGR